MEKAAYFPDCRHLAASFPATTVATLATGAWPAQHGIVADSWYDRPSHRAVTATEEDLRATTLAAQVSADARMRVYLVGMEETPTNLFAGAADARLFWMDEGGRFVASGDAPDWLAGYNEQRGPDAHRNAKWLAVGAAPDAPPLRTLTWSADHASEFVTLYKSSPFGQGTQFDFAGELIAREKLGQGSTVDLVCLLSSSTALLGYEAGARSPLMQQMAMHLDRRIEALINQLAKVPGETAFNLIVAGAHGAPPEPTPEFRERAAVKGESVAQLVQKSLTATGMGRVERYIYPFLYLDTSGFRDPEPIRLAAARAALDHPAVAAWYTARGASSTDSDWQRRFRNSFHPLRSGDVMLSYHPEYIEDYGSSRGISYGSLYNYDVRVPVFFYGPSFRPGVFEAPIESVDIVPTIARAMGVAAPSSASGRVLGEALVE